MKKFFKIVDSSGETHQLSATGIASFFKNAGNRLEIEYVDGSQVVLTTSVDPYTDADTDALADVIIALSQSKWTSTTKILTLSSAPTVAFTF